VSAASPRRTAFYGHLSSNTSVTRRLRTMHHPLTVHHSRWPPSLASIQCQVLEAPLALKDSLPATRGSPASELAPRRRQIACERIHRSSHRGAKVTRCVSTLVCHGDGTLLFTPRVTKDDIVIRGSRSVFDNFNDHPSFSWLTLVILSAQD